jgi:hypothetical protein
MWMLWDAFAATRVLCRLGVAEALRRVGSIVVLWQGRRVNVTSLGGGLLEWCRSIGLTADFVAQLTTGDDAEFTEHFLQVIFDGVSGDEQPVGDFLVRVAGGCQKRCDHCMSVRPGLSCTSRIIVCVNMLGEGFDLPALKVAAPAGPAPGSGHLPPGDFVSGGAPKESRAMVGVSA